MAKKKVKRGSPTKQCPKCGATMHIRKGQCPECNYQFTKKVKAVPAAAKRTRAAKRVAANGPLATLTEAAETIRELGGLEKTKELIAAAKAAQPAVERLGGLENAEALVESLEALKGL